MKRALGWVVAAALCVAACGGDDTGEPGGGGTSGDSGSGGKGGAGSSGRADSGGTAGTDSLPGGSAGEGGGEEGDEGGEGGSEAGYGGGGARAGGSSAGDAGSSGAGTAGAGTAGAGTAGAGTAGAGTAGAGTAGTGTAGTGTAGSDGEAGGGGQGGEAGESPIGGQGGDSGVGGTSSGGSNNQSGGTDSGASAASGTGTGGSSGTDTGTGGSSGTDAGTGGSAGTDAGTGGSAGSSAGSAGASGGGNSEPGECTFDTDCDALRGASPCGGWRCTGEQRCEAASPGCSDADGDGYGAGDACACEGLDCDDTDPDVFSRVRRTCGLASGPHGGCFASVRLCVDGSWSECRDVEGEQLPGGAEACNGEDDDCDGAVDEDLGEVSCGFGVCRRSVRACRGGALSVCVPGTPATATDGCNGLDDDCDGSTDEDCGQCVRVTPDGDDTAAAASDGATPFRNVQPAIDFAATHPSAPRRICVAAGTACGASATFDGPDGANLTLSDGLALLGRFESTTWTRCASSTTRLAPKTATGVAFPASITSGATLDGFSIDRWAASTTAGVTVDGAKKVVLSAIAIETGPASSVSYGVNVVAGGEARIVTSRITGGAGTDLAVGIRASGGRVELADNCASLDESGRCYAVYSNFTTPHDTCSAGLSISGRNTPAAFESYAVWLDQASGSRIERSALCAQGESLGSSSPQARVASIKITGNGAGVAMRANNVLAATTRGQTVYGITAEDCGGAAPWIADNHAIVAVANFVQASAVHVVGDCHPVIDSNREIAAVINTVSEPTTFAVECLSSAGVGSRCVVSGNQNVFSAGDPPPQALNSQRGGVLCDGSCAKLVGNIVTARARHPLAQQVCVTACRLGGEGLRLRGSGAFVDRNVLQLGCTRTGTGVSAIDSWSRIQNNIINGRSDSSCTSLYTADTGLLVASTEANELDVHSNSISGVGPTCQNGSAGSGVTLATGPPAPSGPRGVFRNNRISNGCFEAPAMYEANADADPRILENNVLLGLTCYGPLSGTASCIEQVNAFTDCVASGNVIDSDDARDGGTTAGAPLWDYFGNPRDGAPDIGYRED